MKTYGLGAIVALCLSLSGCFAFHEDYPDLSCESDLDCFEAQGETCNTSTSTCEVTEEPATAPADDLEPAAWEVAPEGDQLAEEEGDDAR